MGSVAGKGNRSAGKGNRSAGKGNSSAGKGNSSAGKGNSSMDNHDSRSEYTRHATKHTALQSTSLHHNAVSLQSGVLCS